jgi:hypothetical protein
VHFLDRVGSTKPRAVGEWLVLANSTHVGVRRGQAAFYQKADVGNRTSAFQ